MGGIIVFYKVFWLLVSFSVIRINLPWLMKLLVRGFMALEFLLEDQRKEFRESLSLYLLFLKYPQHKITNIPKPHILEWHVLNSFIYQYFIKLAPKFRLLINQEKLWLCRLEIGFSCKRNDKCFWNFWIWKLNSLGTLLIA